MTTVAARREDELIAIITSAAGAGAQGIGDDAAILSLPGACRLTVSCDTLVAGHDFDSAWASMEDIGHKALAVNLSDLAAMGATPLGCVCSLALPAATTLDELRAFASSLGSLALASNCPLVGGDLSAMHGPLTITITVMGSLSHAPLTRGTSVVGDEIHVTGTLGAAAAGLALLADHPALAPRYPMLVAAQLRPQAQLALGQALARSGCVSAAMDLSDGLAADLPRLLTAGHGAALDLDHLPVAPGVVELAHELGIDLASWTIRGGEDYCLLLTAAPEHGETLRRLAGDHDAALHTIGRVTATGPVLLGHGFDHFGGQHEHS